MKKIFRRLAPVFVVLIFFCVALGDNFRSVVIAGSNTQSLPRVHADQFMVIRNFTQEDGSVRGVVTVTTPPGNGTPIAVLTAAVLADSPPDVINSVIIAGPADVSVTCGDTIGNCFISFKKDSNN